MTKILLFIICSIIHADLYFASQLPSEQTEKLGWTASTVRGSVSRKINDEAVIRSIKARFSDRSSQLKEITDQDYGCLPLIKLLSDVLSDQLTAVTNVLNSATKNSEMFDALGKLGDSAILHGLFLFVLNYGRAFSSEKQRIYEYDLVAIYLIIDYVYSVCDKKFIRADSLFEAIAPLVVVRSAEQVSIEQIKKALPGKPTNEDLEYTLLLFSASKTEVMNFIYKKGLNIRYGDVVKKLTVEPLMLQLKGLFGLSLKHPDVLENSKKQLGLIKDAILSQVSVKKVAD